MKISKYGTFGIHQEWVDQYLTDTDSFWEDNFLGVKQVPSFKAWLKDAEIIDEKSKLTSFGELCVETEKTQLFYGNLFISIWLIIVL